MKNISKTIALICPLFWYGCNVAEDSKGADLSDFTDNEEPSQEEPSQNEPETSQNEPKNNQISWQIKYLKIVF